MNDGFNQLKVAKSFLQERLGDAPEIGLVLGSGLGLFAREIEEECSFPTQDIPGAIPSNVVGHQGKICLGQLDHQKVIIQSGRVHGYEGYSPAQVVFVVRALAHWGVRKFIISNAAGSTNPDFAPGSIVLIKDHINFTGQSPLIGKELFNGPRFPDMTDLYSAKLRSRLKEKLKENEHSVHEGTYIGVMGPSYETAAEVQMFRSWGADVVGMSTVWEVLALRQMGAQILGISCVANFGTGVSKTALTSEEVIEKMHEMFPLFSKAAKAAIQVFSSAR